MQDHALLACHRLSGDWADLDSPNPFNRKQASEKNKIAQGIRKFRKYNKRQWTLNRQRWTTTDKSHTHTHTHRIVRSGDTRAGKIFMYEDISVSVLLSSCAMTIYRILMTFLG